MQGQNCVWASWDGSKKVSQDSTVWVMIENPLRLGKEKQIAWLMGPSISSGLNEARGSIWKKGQEKQKYNT